MTLEQLARRLSGVLVVCGGVVLLIALACSVGGNGAAPVVVTLHHLFGLVLAVLGGVLVVVGLSLASLVSQSAPPATPTGHDVQDRGHGSD